MFLLCLILFFSEVRLDSDSRVPYRVYEYSGGLHASSSGLNLSHISIHDLWDWSPLRRGIELVSGDSFRENAFFACAGDRCSFSQKDFDSSNATLPLHIAIEAQLINDLLSIVNSSVSRHSFFFVRLPNDLPVDQKLLEAVSSDSRFQALFSINISPLLMSKQLFGVPIGLEQRAFSRGRHSGMYLHQSTGFNLAAKLCWSPVLLSELITSARIDFPLLYMNFQSVSNPSVRVKARDSFSGRDWAINHVDLPYNWGEGVPPIPIESSMPFLLSQAWEAAAEITKQSWFLDVCGFEPKIPRGLAPDLVQSLGLPGYPHFLQKLALFPFILAPEGRGIATHRAWEALYAGSIPIIHEVGNAMDEMYMGLPVLMVESWEEVTPDLMLCFAAELLLKAVGFMMDATPQQQRRESYFFRSFQQPLGRPVATLCAPVLAEYTQRHLRTHPGYISLNSLDYWWWHRHMHEVASRPRS